MLPLLLLVGIIIGTISILLTRFLFRRPANVSTPNIAATVRPNARPAKSESAEYLATKLKIKTSNPKIMIAGDLIFWKDGIESTDIDILRRFFCDLSQIGDIYILIRALSEAEESSFISMMQSYGLNDFIKSHRYLFFETDIGKRAAIRQLEPHCYIDADEISCSETAERVPSVIRIYRDSVSSASNSRYQSVATLKDLLS